MWKKRSYPTCVFGKGVSDFVLHLSAGVMNDEIGTRSKEASLKFRELDCIASGPTGERHQLVAL